jgi:hypothetical protein
MITTSIDEDSLLFDLSNMVCTSVDETTDNAVVLTNKPLTENNPRPQLDASTSTATTYDDSMSVCSVSSFGSTATTPTMDHRPTRRSVFSKYWKTTGQEPPMPLKRRSRDLNHKSAPSHSSSNTELFSSTSAGDIAKSPSSFGRRRSILPQTTRSYSLPSLYASPLITRKVVSNFELSSSPPPSCLRERRFSGRRSNESSLRSNNSSSVRFDMDSINVLYFSPPLETFAEDDRWSDHFA